MKNILKKNDFVWVFFVFFLLCKVNFALSSTTEDHPILEYMKSHQGRNKIVATDYEDKTLDNFIKKAKALKLYGKVNIPNKPLYLVGQHPSRFIEEFGPAIRSIKNALQKDSELTYSDLMDVLWHTIGLLDEKIEKIDAQTLLLKHRFKLFIDQNYGGIFLFSPDFQIISEESPRLTYRAIYLGQMRKRHTLIVAIWNHVAAVFNTDAVNFDFINLEARRMEDFWRCGENLVEYYGRVSIFPSAIYFTKIYKKNLNTYWQDRHVAHHRQLFCPSNFIKIALQMAKAVQGLHELGVIHRDVSAPNFFVDYSDPQNPDVALGNLGSHVNFQSTAPEMHQRTPISNLTDNAYEKSAIFTFALTLLDMMGANPFKKVDFNSNEYKNLYGETNHSKIKNKKGEILYLFITNHSKPPKYLHPSLNGVYKFCIDALTPSPLRPPNISELIETLENCFYSPSTIMIRNWIKFAKATLGCGRPPNSSYATTK